MQTVNDYFKKLSFGVFSNLAIGMQGIGEIKVESQNAVIHAMNQALNQLYTRFPLLEKEVLIRLFGHVTNYHMDKRFAKNNPERLPKHPAYILDLPQEPFINDVIKILAVFDIAGNQIALNDERDPMSVYTPNPTVLQVPFPAGGMPLSVRYQAAHEKLQYGVKEAEIRVPTVLENAYIQLIAFHVYSNMNTQESLAKAVLHNQSYENECTTVESQGHASILTVNMFHKFDQKGFA